MPDSNPKPDLINKMPKEVWVGAFAVLVMGCILTFFLSETWATRQDYSFGYLMPIFALYVIFDRKEKVFAYFSNVGLTSKPKYSLANLIADAFFGGMLFCGLAVFFLFAFMLIAAQESGSLAFPITFGFSFSFIAMAYFAAARKPSTIKERLGFVCLFIFPAFAWLISAPLFSSVENLISLFLLSKVAKIVYAVMTWLGYVVELNGNSLTFPNGSVGVADACSGIRSLTACLFAGSFLAAVFLDKFWKKVLLVLVSMCLAFFNNILRALFLSFWAYQNGPESISGFVHDAAGYFVLGMTVVGLLVLLPIFQFSRVPPGFKEESEDGAANTH